MQDFPKNNVFEFFQSIQEIVLVRTEGPLVEVYRRRTAERQWLLQIYGPGEEVDLTRLDVQMPMDVIYLSVIFPKDALDEEPQ